MHIQGTKCYLETLRDASEHPKSFGDTPLIVPGGRSFECRIRKA
jgi:hypothetical protein